MILSDSKIYKYQNSCRLPTFLRRFTSVREIGLFRSSLKCVQNLYLKSTVSIAQNIHDWVQIRKILIFYLQIFLTYTKIFMTEFKNFLDFRINFKFWNISFVIFLKFQNRCEIFFGYNSDILNLTFDFIQL